MLLTLRTTHVPATELGFLLHKHPARVQSFSASFGEVHVFYPETTAGACTAALLLDVDPVGLVRGRQGPSGEGGLLDQYVNDRPYVASSFMSVAISAVFRSAMAGQCKEREELARSAIPLSARVSALPCRGGEPLLRKLFEPLGYTVTAIDHPLDETHPEWGDSRCFTVELSATTRLSELLTHLYVLIPVLDDGKHYWVGDDEVDKLLKHGEGWLGAHPERALITERYLKHRRSLVDEAISRLTVDEAPEAESADQEDAAELAVEQPVRLIDQRLSTVLAALRASGAHRVLDLGCGEGKLVKLLLGDTQFTEIVGMDVSYRSLEIASERLHLERMPAKQKDRLRILHGSLMYRDARLTGFEAAAVVEVIEHLDPPRLAAFERVVFEFARPGTVVITTPNAEYNPHWESLPAGQFRHKDHRFEWTRAQFSAWSEGIASRFAYEVRFTPIGPEDPALGAPTQMAIFTRSGA
jgi:3' terminal RNA ribose 2'-O-methyltransferase Hen1